MFLRSGLSLLLASTVIVSCFSRGHFQMSDLGGNLTRTPDFVEHGKEVRLSCKFFLRDEHEKMKVVLAVTSGDGKTIETYKNATSKYRNEDGRWVVAQDISFTASSEDDPVKAECFYKVNLDRMALRYSSDGQKGMDMVKNLLTMIIDIFVDPELVEIRGCDGQPIETCVLHCKIVHKNSLKFSPDTCQWRYRPSADAPTVLVASNSNVCTHVHGTRDEMSLDLKDRGAFAGQYVCHAEYSAFGVEQLKTYTVNGVIEINSTMKGSDLNGPCTSQQQCRTYQAKCIKGTCQCAEEYPKVHKTTVEGLEYVLSCYGEGESPPSACIEPVRGLLDNGLLMLVTLLLVLATTVYMACIRDNHQRMQAQTS